MSKRGSADAESVVEMTVLAVQFQQFPAATTLLIVFTIRLSTAAARDFSDCRDCENAPFLPVDGVRSIRKGGQSARALN